MKRKCFLEKLGFKYIRNPRTKEIHHVPTDYRCNIHKLSDGRYCTRLWVWFLIKFYKHDGCGHCFQKFNNINK